MAMPGQTPPTSSARNASTCGDAQQQAAHQCAEAARLAEAATFAEEQLSAARRQRGELLRAFDTDPRLSDHRALSDAKVQARATYRTGYEHARDSSALMVATATWMDEVSRMNRGARRAARDGQILAARKKEIDAVIDQLQLSLEAARIAAGAARQACLDARRTLAACEEARDPLPTPTRSDAPAMVALLRGDRQMLQSLVARLAEEIGEDAGRLQLLMLDLRDAIITSGRGACVFSFPHRHPFWGQFTLAEARAVASALDTLGRRFDGQHGWENGIVAHPREVAMAISMAGHDPRSVRRQPTPAEIETLWQGTSVAAAEFLFDRAPDLRLDALIALLGSRADALAELWDNWGRLRPMLLGPGPQTP